MCNMGAERMMVIIIALNKFSILVASWRYLATVPNANVVLEYKKIWLLVKQFKFRVVACSITINKFHVSVPRGTTFLMC